ncbi:MAG TPA: DUF6152 family protein [Steroidobacteraceae bacterium]|nr:DUF6152 family protein [Steroidobacteraceae bacterium]
MNKPAFKHMAGTALVVAAGFLAGTAQAHHSVAAFDRDHPATLTGTVKSFTWTNPHTWLYLSVPDGKGGEQEWKLEGGAVNMLVRQGWTNKTMEAGMKVKLLIAPRRDGEYGAGEWLRLLEIDGKPFGKSSTPAAGSTP